MSVPCPVRAPADRAARPPAGRGRRRHRGDGGRGAAAPSAGRTGPPRGPARATGVLEDLLWSGGGPTGPGALPVPRVPAAADVGGGRDRGGRTRRVTPCTASPSTSPRSRPPSRRATRSCAPDPTRPGRGRAGRRPGPVARTADRDRRGAGRRAPGGVTARGGRGPGGGAARAWGARTGWPPSWRQLLRAHPVRERFAELLVRVLAAEGRTARPWRPTRGRGGCSPRSSGRTPRQGLRDAHRVALAAGDTGPGPAGTPSRDPSRRGR